MSAAAPIPDRLPALVLPDQRGRRVVISGASSGIGFETALALAGAGAQVVLGVRTEKVETVGWSQLVTATLEKVTTGVADDPLVHYRGRYPRLG